MVSLNSQLDRQSNTSQFSSDQALLLDYFVSRSQTTCVRLDVFFFFFFLFHLLLQTV